VESAALVADGEAAPLMAELPKATVRGAPLRARIRPKHVVVLFAAISVAGAIQTLVGWTLYYPPLGILLDLAWFLPLVIPLVRKRVRTIAAVLCLAGFAGQALVFELPEALARIGELDWESLSMLVGMSGGLVASVVAIIKPDPDPDFVPNEFTIR
jgi:hypothetical protein